ncbi:hypothetical protein V6N11_035222 [Hibiscus sabdariffa]|uniref:Uncharacterized protein n=1 Tax=Hibiscus sabdariffa TaxID=183260 RepID=A0ABR2QZR0_9ROSI
MDDEDNVSSMGYNTRLAVLQAISLNFLGCRMSKSNICDDIQPSFFWNIRDGERTDFWLDSEKTLVTQCLDDNVPNPTSVGSMVDKSGIWNWQLLSHLITDVSYKFAC